jgi:RimJ/RimL family protein N-acetyltransferase
MPLEPTTLTVLNRYWTGFFGLPPNGLARPGVHIVPHAELELYRGIFGFRRETTAIISVPPDRLRHWQTTLAGVTIDQIDDAAVMARRCAVPLRRVVGPAPLAYADAATLRPVPTAGTRLLTTADETNHALLETACDPAEWAHGGSAFDVLPLVGRFVAGELVALAGYERWGEQIVHIGVITHPAHRRRGYGIEAVSLLAETVIAKGMIAQFRTLRANTAALRLGASLGFAPYAETLALRLNAELERS